MPAERRTFDRVQTAIPAVIAATEQSGERRQAAATILDIGVGGLRLRADARFARGSDARVAFTLPEDESQTEAEVTILACDSTFEGGTIIRARFTHLPPEKMVRIARWTFAEGKRAQRD
jgi:hypothetical protein